MFNTEDEILRRLQEKNLEMAVMFYHWCQRNHLTCYLCGGGCIGAIRHGGFIPWDDDLDFFMPRKDYEKFLKIWDTQEESKIYKLEYPKEGFCNAHTFANIRDSRTTQVKKEQVDMDLCHGVALDILPIEGYAPGNLARKWQVIEGKIFQLFCTQVIPTKERHGAFMHYLGTILLAPTVIEMGVTVHICTTGMPALSISFTIVAPQRVQVPQVEVMMTAFTPACRSFCAYSAANFFALATDVPLPTVV